MKEEIDNVKVEIDRRVNVLLRRHFMHDHVSVVNDEQREQNRSGSGQSTSRCVTVEKQLAKNTRTQKNANTVFQNIIHIT